MHKARVKLRAQKIGRAFPWLGRLSGDLVTVECLVQLQPCPLGLVLLALLVDQLGDFPVLSCPVLGGHGGFLGFAQGTAELGEVGPGSVNGHALPFGFSEPTEEVGQPGDQVAPDVLQRVGVVGHGRVISPRTVNAP
jgi:hypothetical protein